MLLESQVQLVASGGQLPQILELKDLTLTLPESEQRGQIPAECREAANAARMNKDRPASSAIPAMS